MKASELRLGNLIIDNEFPNIVSEIIGVQVKNVVTTHYSEELKVTDIKPIALTEELLIKFGFIKESDYFFIKINPFGTCIYLDIEENIYQIGCENGSWYSHNTEIKYVHQLQNLYFALTGEELIINN